MCICVPYSSMTRPIRHRSRRSRASQIGNVVLTARFLGIKIRHRRSVGQCGSTVPIKEPSTRDFRQRNDQTSLS